MVDYSAAVKEILDLFLPRLAPQEQRQGAADEVEKALHRMTAPLLEEQRNLESVIEVLESRLTVMKNRLVAKEEEVLDKWLGG